MNGNKDIIARVQQMEQYMDEVSDALKNRPADLKRGVLSQDGLYNLIGDVEATYRESAKTEGTDSMNGFDINEMLTMQRTLQDRYKSIWESIGPETGQNKLLWMIGEIGEVIDIVKKNGGTKACSDTKLRKDLVEELADVLMYYNDVLLCYGISAEELKKAYTEKFERNMTRWKA